MITPIAGKASLGEERSRKERPTDLAMNVLQYGMALVAIIVVTLLSAVR